MKKKIVTLLKMVFSVGLLAFLFWELDWAFVQSEIVTINIHYIILFLFFQALAMLISVKKWASIALYQGSYFSLWDGLKAYLTGTFVNNFLPSTIGGDIYRSLWLVKRGEEKRVAFSSVIFDRFTGLLVTLLLGILTAYFVWQVVNPLPHFLTVSYVIITCLTTGLFALIFFVPKSFIAHIPWRKLRAFFEETARYRDAKVWTEASLWGTLFVIFGLGISNYILFLALGHVLPFLPFFGMIVLMALYVALPISINNIGIKEWAYGVLFIYLGVSFETAVTVALLSRVLQTGISLLALPVYLLERKALHVTVDESLGLRSDTP